MDSATEFDTLLKEFNLLSTQIEQQSIDVEEKDRVHPYGSDLRDRPEENSRANESLEEPIIEENDYFDELVDEYQRFESENNLQNVENPAFTNENDEKEKSVSLSMDKEENVLDSEISAAENTICDKEGENANLEESEGEPNISGEGSRSEALINDEYELLLSKMRENEVFLEENDEKSSLNAYSSFKTVEAPLHQDFMEDTLPAENKELDNVHNSIMSEEIHEPNLSFSELSNENNFQENNEIKHSAIFDLEQHYSLEIEEGTKESITFPPCDPSEHDIVTFKNSVKLAFSQTFPVGHVTYAVLKLLEQEHGNITHPPGLFDVFLAVSANTSFGELEKEYQKCIFEMPKTELNFTSFSELVVEREEFLDCVADIFVGYSSISGYEELVPVRTIQAHFHEVADFFKRHTPRIAMGSTIGLDEVEELLHDTSISRIISKGRVSALFTRAVFCEGKYIADYVTFNEKKTVPKIEEMEALNFDFLTYSNIAISVDSLAKKPLYTVNGKLCFFGFLGFVFLLARDFYEMIGAELDTTSKSEAEETVSLSQIEAACCGTNRGSKVVIAPRDPFMNSKYENTLLGMEVLSDNYSYFDAWRDLFKFALLIDLVIIPKAKPAGLFETNMAMCRSVLPVHRKIVEHYYSRLRQVYQNCCRGLKSATLKEVLLTFSNGEIVHILSKTFFTEFILRNFTEVNHDFEPTLTFEEFVNLIYVAGNFAFGSGTYARFLRNGGERFEHAIRDVTGAV